MARFSGLRPFNAGADLSRKLLVKLSAATVVANTKASTDDPIGVTEYNVLTGNPVAVRFLCSDETQEITASGAIALDAVVYADDGGKVQALPAGAGTYRKVGIALEAAFADGDIIEVLPYSFSETTTVA
jgi:hypothetical protein